MTDYKDTLNLPDTDFAMKANLPTKEPKMIEYWEKIRLQEKVAKARKGREKFILHDGPPMPMVRFIWVMLPKRY